MIKVYITALLLTEVHSFTSTSSFTRHSQINQITALHVDPQRKVSTESDLLNQEEDVPKLFSKQTYDDFQSALLTLEKRVADGPNSLSLEEYTKFDAETGRIVREMREYMADPEGMKSKIAKEYEVDASSAEIFNVGGVKDAGSAAVEAALAAKEVVEKVAQTEIEPPAANPSPPPASNNALSTEFPPLEDEDLPKGAGFGLAAGTTNTFVIPGMNEMSGPEYRAKLQETISARQAVRREQAIASGTIGNRSSNGYLDTLSPPRVDADEKEDVEQG